jgi:hypothetical protein
MGVGGFPEIDVGDAPMVAGVPEVLQSAGAGLVPLRVERSAIAVNAVMAGVLVGSAAWGGLLWLKRDRVSRAPEAPERCDCGKRMSDGRVFQAIPGSGARGRWFQCESCKISRIVLQ